MALKGEEMSNSLQYASKFCNISKLKNLTKLWKQVLFFLVLRHLLQHGSIYVGLNAGFSGLIANSLYRRILHVTKARMASSFPMALMPFMTASITFTGFVSLPLSSGMLYLLSLVCLSTPILVPKY